MQSFGLVLCRGVSELPSRHHGEIDVRSELNSNWHYFTCNLGVGYYYWPGRFRGSLYSRDSKALSPRGPGLHARAVTSV